jgi:hypothetical protein
MEGADYTTARCQVKERDPDAIRAIRALDPSVAELLN